MKNDTTKLITDEQVDAMIIAFQSLLCDFAGEIPKVKKALKNIANKQLLHKDAQKEIIKLNKKK